MTANIFDPHTASAEAQRIMAALERYTLINHVPAVPEPTNDFERTINVYHDTKSLLAEIKSLIKPLEAIERQQRDGIAESLRQHFGDSLKEGTNNYVLSNQRKVKFGNSIDRKVEVGEMANARKLFEEAEDKPAGITFDELFRPTYEVAKAKYSKVLNGSTAFLAISRCLVTKNAAPSIEVD